MLIGVGLEWRWTGSAALAKGFRWRETAPGRGYWWTDELAIAQTVADHAPDKVDPSAAKALRIAHALPVLSRAPDLKEARASGLFPARVLNAIESLRSKSGKRLYPYQQAGVATVLLLHTQAQRGALLGDSMGLGKTPQSIAVARLLGWKSCLIVAPNAVLHNWKEEIADWWGVGFRIGSTKQGIGYMRHCARTLEPCRVLVPWTSAVKVQRALEGVDLWFKGCIFDEGHFGKNPAAKRTRAAWGYNYEYRGETRRCLGLAERVRGGSRPLILTGTPLPNRPIEIQPLLAAVGVAFAKEYDAFGRRYCSGYGYAGPDYGGACHLDELAARLEQAGVIRRTVDEVLKDIPPIQTQAIIFPGEGKSVGVRRVLAKERSLVSEEVRRKLRSSLDIGTMVPFEDLARVRAEMAAEKPPSVADHILRVLEELPEEQGVVVFWHHKAPITETNRLLVEKDPSLEHRLSTVTGDVPMKQRQDAVERFKRGRSRIFQGTIGTVGTGINGLQYRSRVCMFADYPWTPGEIAQAIGRLRRIGQKGAVLAQLLAFEGSLDAYVMRLILQKIDIHCKIFREDEAENAA